MKTMTGMTFVVWDATVEVLAKLPKKRKNKRWRKKYLKRFGTTFAPILKTGDIFMNSKDRIAYVNSATLSIIRNHPDLRKATSPLASTGRVMSDAAQATNDFADAFTYAMEGLNGD